MEISREDLYASVWREPMTRLALHFGMSQFALASLCRKLQVPTPPRGHWSKLAHGKASPQPPLPALELEVSKKTRHPRPVGPRQNLAPRLTHLPSAPALIVTTSEVVPEQPVAVPERLSNLHPLVRATADAMAGMEPDKYGMIRPRRFPSHPKDPVPLDIRVRPTLKTRAQRLADLLLKALIARGYAVDTGQHEDRSRGQCRADHHGSHWLAAVVVPRGDGRPHGQT